MPYPIPCKYCIKFLCKLSLFQKVGLLLRDHLVDKLASFLNAATRETAGSREKRTQL
jgi:hypothetical protein